jgi:hypothetical protein
MIKIKFSKWFFRSLAAATILINIPAGAALAATPAVQGHGPIRHLKHGTSTNWSGYAAYGAPGKFNSVSANWVQPAVNCTTVPNSYSSYWVGLDGYSSSTVEQLGTEADCSNGVASYYAWYEMYPHRGYYISIPVGAGNSFSASVTYTGGSRFTLRLTNHSDGLSFSTSQRLSGAQRSSAEAIVEAPYSGGILPLANYGTASFTGAVANNLPLGGYSPLDPITMINPAGMKSTPQAFDSTKENFTVTWSAN